MATSKMVHYPAAASTFDPPLIAHTNHFLGDVSSSEQDNPEKPITAGFYRFEPGQKLVYTYTYDEMKIILEGEAQISDSTGNEVNAKAGDVFYFPAGTVITFSTSSACKAFFCGQRKQGAA